MKKLILLTLFFIPILGISQEDDTFYVEDIPSYNGPTKFYYNNGDLKMEINYTDGIRNGERKLYHQNGRLKQKESWVNGIIEGNVIGYYDDGVIEFQLFYKSGKREGISKKFYKNGKLNIEKYYKNDKNITFFKKYYENGNTSFFNITNESIREYFDIAGAKGIEGLYTYKNSDINNNASFTLAILKYKYKYKAHIISSYCDYCKPFDIGKIKAEIIEGAIDGIYDVTWKYKKKNVLTAGAKNFINFSEKQRNFLLSIDLNGGILKGNPISLIKLYPKIYSKAKSIKNGEWAGNGSGVIISKSGHIITNHHVIEDAEKIEVEFMLDDELQKFNAEVVQVDKTNDLAVLKIFDMNFDGVSEPPYNFKFRGSDVGTKVYAFGYPMALSIMGKEIKVTDGMISSKTGFDGNITTYQITAPIQGGNSGGPLFDEQANLIGINSSGIRKDIADNVAYSIKTSYVSNLLDVLPKSIELPSSTKLKSLPLTEQIKEISKYVVLVKVK